MGFIPFHQILAEPNEQMGFSKFDLAYWKNPHQFINLINGLPNLSTVNKQIEFKKNFTLRNEIADILTDQYKFFPESDPIHKQIEKLRLTNTFTVICAHQPCLLGGPMYWAYKILSVIALCNILNKILPDFNFIPVYYSGNEDHDFNEINNLTIFHTNLSWNEKSGQANGRLPISGLTEVFDKLASLFNNNIIANQFIDKNRHWLQESENYGDYYHKFVHDLFGPRGLIYFNPDCHAAKNLFSQILRKEITNNFIIQNTQRSNKIITSLHFPLQVNPRELNVFFHHSTGRKRLVKHENKFHILDTDEFLSESEILDRLDQSPENFSPNVLLRPLYQEYLFPNIAFVGGGGEIAYWLQLKECFENVSIPYPILFRRLSAIIIDRNLYNKIEKSNISVEDYLLPVFEIEAKFIKLISSGEDLLDNELFQFEKLLNQIKSKCEALDASTKSSIESELQKIHKSIEHIISKRNKVLKQRHDQTLTNIRKIKESLFPAGSLQERTQSFLPNYFQYGNAYFDMIQNSYQPENNHLVLFVEKEQLVGL